MIKVKLKERIKNSILILWLEDIKLSKFAKMKKANKRKIILLGTPFHGNYGDHLIAEVEKKFFHEYFSDRLFFDLSMKFSLNNINRIKKVINDDDLIIISGGGWLGSVWPRNDLFVRHILKEFSSNYIVIMPQTMFYENDAIDNEDEVRNIYNNCEKLLFFLRENKSFNFCQSNGLAKGKTVIFPDLALLYEIPSMKKRSGIERVGLCFRNDIEKQITAKTVEDIKKILLENNKLIDYVTTNEIGTRISMKNREKMIQKKIGEIESFDLLITDRLHAMIIAFITKTPCLAFDNSTNKIAGVYEWIKDCGFIKLISNADNLINELDYDNLKKLKSNSYAWNVKQWKDTLYRYIEQLEGKGF